jgi:hypothetical protein
MLLLACIAITILLPACQQAPNHFQVLSLDIEPPEVKVGEKATISAELRNGNASAETYNVPLMVNGVAQDRKTVMLTPGATEVVEFSLTKYKAGSYRISIGDRSSTLEVQAPLPAFFQISELGIVPTVANFGEKIIITARVANTGGAEGSYTAELKIDDCTVQTEKWTMAAGTKATLSFRVCTDLPGTYTVTLGELTGKFTVIEPVQPIPPNNPPGTTTIPSSNRCRARG